MHLIGLKVQVFKQYLKYTLMSKNALVLPRSLSSVTKLKIGGDTVCFYYQSCSVNMQMM